MNTRTMKYTINLVHVVMMPLMVWLGVTNRVDWWVIILVFMSMCKLDISRTFTRLV